MGGLGLPSLPLDIGHRTTRVTEWQNVFSDALASLALIIVTDRLTDGLTETGDWALVNSCSTALSSSVLYSMYENDTSGQSVRGPKWVKYLLECWISLMMKLPAEEEEKWTD